PNRTAFVSKIDFQEHGQGFGRGHHLGITVRDKGGAGFDWLGKTDPSYERCAGNWYGPVLESAIQMVDRQLVGDEEIRDQDLIVRTPQTSIWHVRDIRSLLRYAVKRFLPTCGCSEEISP